MTGCPDLEQPAHTHISRTHDTATVTCTHSPDVWYLTCEGDTWRGVLGNCTPAGKHQAESHEASYKKLLPVTHLTISVFIVRLYFFHKFDPKKVVNREYW